MKEQKNPAAAVEIGKITKYFPGPVPSKKSFMQSATPITINMQPAKKTEVFNIPLYKNLLSIHSINVELIEISPRR
nr:hypothetical protein [Xanthomonas oryzae]